VGGGVDTAARGYLLVVLGDDVVFDLDKSLAAAPPIPRERQLLFVAIVLIYCDAFKKNAKK
jgi:hypothetical protein